MSRLFFTTGKGVNPVISFMLLLMFIVFTESGAASDVTLPNTSIRIPWTVFDSLVKKAPDTVTMPVKSEPPVAITFDNMQLTAVLHDSMAEISLDGFYKVLTQKGWAQERLFYADDRAVSSMSVAAGDVVRLTDEGYMLVADASGGEHPRRIRMTWSVYAKSSEGVSSLQTGIPPCLQSVLTIVAPVSFAEVTVRNGFLQQQVATGAMHHYKYLLSASSNNCEITWQPPVRSVAADTIDNTEDIASSDLKNGKPVITARQETALFLNKESRFAFIAIHLSVARLRVSHFVIQLPDSFVLLSINGKGLQASKMQKQNGAIECKLAFDLEGDYTFYIAGEISGDSMVDIPAVRVMDAAHQTGIFAVTTEKGTEAQYVSAVNCNSISQKDFINELSPDFTDSLARYEHSLNDISLVGQYFRIPFIAKIKLRSYPPVAVADAVCDAGSLRSVISTDGKILTQATYSIRRRGRQFVSLSLPDSASLWSVMLDGVPLSPSADENGRYKISLQRDYYSDASGNRQLLEVTYLLLSQKKSCANAFRMIAPVPDIPVSRLDWTAFYPENWSVKKVDGSFIAAQKNIFGSHYLHINKNERQSLYSMLQQTNATQQAAAAEGINVLTLMPESPKHIYGYMIIVANEQPWMEIQFGSASVDGIVITIVLVVVVGLGLIFGVFGLRVIRKH